MNPDAVAELLLPKPQVTFFRKTVNTAKWFQIVSHLAVVRSTALRSECGGDEERASQKLLNVVISIVNTMSAASQCHRVLRFVLAHALFEQTETLVAMRDAEHLPRN